jgi:DNA-binding winged helix-turn-helix (wHTH) protein
MGSGAEKGVFRFDRFRLDLVSGVLSRTDGAELALRPKSFAMLRHFVEQAGRLVDRDEIMRVVWPGIFVTDDNIAQCVREIRRVLAMRISVSFAQCPVVVSYLWHLYRIRIRRLQKRRSRY